MTLEMDCLLYLVTLFSLSHDLKPKDFSISSSAFLMVFIISPVGAGKMQILKGMHHWAHEFIHVFYPVSHPSTSQD